MRAAMASSDISQIIRRAREVQRLQIAGMTHGLEQAMELIAYYAKNEHKYTRRTGLTEQTTEGGIYEATAAKVVGIVSASMSYDRFLECARNGEWAFLWPALMEHKEEVLALIVQGGSLGPMRK